MAGAEGTSLIRVQGRAADSTPSPACGGGLGWGLRAMQASLRPFAPIPTFPRARGKGRQA